jgi:hypothetical protein
MVLGTDPSGRSVKPIPAGEDTMPFSMEWESDSFDMKLNLDNPGCPLREMVSEPHNWCLAAEAADILAYTPFTPFLSSPMKRKSYADFGGPSKKR